MLLFAMAIGGVGLAALGEKAHLRALREQEAELRFRGDEIARAIASYVDAGPAGSRALPGTVDELLEDRRTGRPVRHLRQWRGDPLGGEWIWLHPGDAGCGAPVPRPDRAQGLVGVRSSSTRLLLRRTTDKPAMACELLFHFQHGSGGKAPFPSPNGSS